MCDRLSLENQQFDARTAFGKLTRSCQHEYIASIDSSKLQMQSAAIESIMASLGFRISTQTNIRGFESSMTSVEEFSKAVGILTSYGCTSFVDMRG